MKAEFSKDENGTVSHVYYHHF